MIGRAIVGSSARVSGAGAPATLPRVAGLGSDVAPHRIEGEPPGRRDEQRLDRHQVLPVERGLEITVEVDGVVRVAENEEEPGRVDHLTHEHPGRAQALDEVRGEPFHAPGELGRVGGRWAGEGWNCGETSRASSSWSRWSNSA